MRACWPAPSGRPPPTPHCSNRISESRRVAAGGGSGASPPQTGNHCHLREGGQKRVAHTGTTVAGIRAMNRLRAAVDDYLALRRTLGYSLQRDGHLLPKFIDHLQAVGADYVTTPLALAWA